MSASIVRLRQHRIPSHPLDLMPFMRVAEARRVFWCPALTDSYHQNYCAGQTFGWDMVSLLRRPEADTSYLGSVARDMILGGTDGHHDGAVCGFMNSIAQAVVGMARA